MGAQQDPEEEDVDTVRNLGPCMLRLGLRLAELYSMGLVSNLNKDTLCAGGSISQITFLV